MLLNAVYFSAKLSGTLFAGYFNCILSHFYDSAPYYPQVRSVYLQATSSLLLCRLCLAEIEYLNYISDK